MYSIEQLEAKGVKIIRERGDEVLALCPFHDDKHPSFSANLTKGVFYCHACHKKGTFKQLGLKGDETVYFESFDELLDSGTDIKELVFSLPQEYRKLEKRDWHNAKFWDYLAGRGLDKTTIKEFEIGYCASGQYADRVIIPLGLGFVARSIYNSKEGFLLYGKNHKKYLYPLGLPIARMLFNFYEDWETLILVEGSFDAMKLVSYGLNATAVFSCSMSRAQVKVLCKASEAETVYLCFDGDQPGRDGMNEAAPILARYFEDVYVVYLPEKADPASCDKEVFFRCLREARSCSTWGVSCNLFDKLFRDEEEKAVPHSIHSLRFLLGVSREDRQKSLYK